MTAPQATFEFVAVDPTTKLKPGKSLQVRSRCMQGKNKRQWTTGRQRSKKTNTKETNAASVSSQKPTAARLPLPNTLISDLAFIHFATGDAGINAEDRGLLFKAFAYNFANQSLSPLDRCVDFDCLESASFEWAFQDTAYLHSVLCTSYAINDFLSPGWDGSPGRKTLFHLRETLALLQAKMDNENIHHDESLLLVVMNLALLSAMYGDWLAAGAHFKGLHKIVQLRGNLEFLKARPKLHFKLDRVDLASSLSSGKKLYFLHPSVSWQPIIAAPYSPLPQGLYQPPSDWDYRIANVFQDFQYLSLRINRNALKRARHDPACFQAVLTSLQSRLAHLADIVKTPTEELVRLTMMALLTTTFKTPGRKLPYDWIIKRLGDVYTEAGSGPLQYDHILRLWVLITVAFTITGMQPAWLQDAWRETGLGLSWQVVKSHLMRVMWIELIHDKPGEEVFHQLEDMISPGYKTN